MAIAAYTTGPVNNVFASNNSHVLLVNILNRNTVGNVDATVRLFNASGSRTLVSEDIVIVPPNIGSTVNFFNIDDLPGYDVVVIVNHPSNVNEVLVSVWGIGPDPVDPSNKYLPHHRFAHTEMHRLF
jgi:hypothetical protein